MSHFVLLHDGGTPVLVNLDKVQEVQPLNHRRYNTRMVWEKGGAMPVSSCYDEKFEEVVEKLNVKTYDDGYRDGYQDGVDDR